MNISFNLKLSRFASVLLIIILFASSLAGVYYFYWTKTPEYSFKLIQKAVKEHDLDKFKKHVDLDTVIPRMIDDVGVNSTNKKDLNIATESLLQLFKPSLVSLFKEKILYYVEEGTDKKVTIEGRSTDKNLVLVDEEISSKLDYTSFQINEISRNIKEGKMAIIRIKLFNTQLDKSFTLNIKMRELQDGTWQLTELTNLKEFLASIEKAKHAYYASPPPIIKELKVNNMEYNDEICTLKYPNVEIPNNRDVEQKINSTIKSRVDKAIESGDYLNKIPKLKSPPYSMKLKYEIYVNDGKLFSISLENYSYSGGAHGMSSEQGMVFDAKTGNILRWSDMYPIIDNVRKEKINNTIAQKSKENKISLSTPFKGIEETKNPIFYVGVNYKPTLIFQPYEIGPYSSGILKFELPLEITSGD